MPPKPDKHAALYLVGTEDADMRRAILTDEAKLRHWQAVRWRLQYHDQRHDQWHNDSDLADAGLLRRQPPCTSQRSKLSLLQQGGPNRILFP
jgi:hypothetical protein